MIRKKTVFLLLLLSFALSQTAFAHSGRTDKYGGHNSPSGYHYHNGGGSSSSSSSSSTKRTIYPSSVKVTRPSGTIYAGRNIKLTSTVSPSNANDKSIKWSSSNESVARVYSDGTLTPISAGTTTITATTSNGRTDKFNITVSLVDAESISFVNPPNEIEIGQTGKLIYSIAPKDTTNKTVRWESSDSGIIAVDDSGNIEVLSLGSATISVTTANELVAEHEINVYEIEVEEVILEVSKTYCDVGTSISYNVSLLPENATFKEYEIIFSNPDMVELVDDDSFKALKQGGLMVSAVSKNGKESSVNIDVILPVSEIIVTENDIVLYEREEYSIEYSVLPRDATIKDVSFSSLDSGVISLDSYGKIIAVKNGETSVSIATHNNLVAKINIIVKPVYEKWFFDYGWYLFGGVMVVAVLGVSSFFGIRRFRKKGASV
ncbi:MAG: Ig-like domain-containing protein [Oscillospiraceae bacterium]|nr:Ig-like domain-containing protein [Oscillospiraceae bacterium]